MLHETDPQFQVVCDGSGCYEEGPVESSETKAEKSARDEGFDKIGDLWFCSTCMPKRRRAAKKGCK
jgi:hypothetical protein